MKRSWQNAGVTALAGLAWLLLAGFPAWGNDPLPPADEIVRKALENGKRAEEKKLYGNYTFTRRAVIEKLDGKGQVKEREEWVFRVYPINELLYPRLVEKNGKPLSGDELKREEEKEKKFRETADQQKRHKDDFQLFFNEELVSRYRFQMGGREDVEGRTAYVLTFEPKSDDLPVKKRRDRILNKLSGKIWIDAEEFGVAKLHVDMKGGLSFGLGILGAVKKFTGDIEMARMEKDFWLPQRADVWLEGRIFVSPIRQKHHLIWSEFTRLEPQTAEKAAHR